MDEVVLNELVDLLLSPSLQVRKHALDLVLRLTASDEELSRLKVVSSPLVSSLHRLLQQDEQDDIIKGSICCCLNMTLEEEIAKKMVEEGMIETVLPLSLQTESKFRQLLIMLLGNLTRHDHAVHRLLEINKKNSDKFYLGRLIRHFALSNSSDSESDEDEYKYVGNILVNLSRIEEGRMLLLDPKFNFFKLILPLVQSQSYIRRQTISSAVRNCCFESTTRISHILHFSEFLLPTLLIPLAGLKAYEESELEKMPIELSSSLSHERTFVFEPQIKIELAEALFLVVSHEEGRKELWKVNGPHILKIGYETEEDPKVMDAYERLGSLLITPGGETTC